MITKERLEELIKEDKVICNQYIDYDNNICYRYGKVSIIQDDDEQHIELKLNGTNASVIMYDTKYLYESKEDAEEYLKYGNIQKTVTLNLPTWKEFNKFNPEKEKYFYRSKDYYMFESEHQGTIYLSKLHNSILISHNDGSGFIDPLKSFKLSRKNYDKARDLCVKLFKGEEV